MTKKLLGLAVLALLCAGFASASTFFEYCPPGGTQQSTGQGSTPTISGFATCAPFVVPAGQTLTSVELFLEGDYSSAASGSSTLTFTYTITTGGSPFSLTSLIDSASGISGSSSYTFIPTGSSCINGQTYNGVAYAAAANTVDCPTTSGVPLVGLGTYSSITVSAAGSWVGGSAGLLPNGSENFNVFALFTYSPTQVTPEPSTLLMIGGGLIGLVMAGRRKFTRS